MLRFWYEKQNWDGDSGNGVGYDAVWIGRILLVCEDCSDRQFAGSNLQLVRKRHSALLQPSLISQLRSLVDFENKEDINLA
jgi:hypothetical protein